MNFSFDLKEIVLFHDFDGDVFNHFFLIHNKLLKPVIKAVHIFMEFLTGIYRIDKVDKYGLFVKH